MPKNARERHTQILIVGGGTGGVAAALAAASLGARVIVTEETDWLGGQLTSQAVPPDEHPWIESFGCTARYRAYRDGVRRYYRDHYPLSSSARANPRLNPGLGMVSHLCHEPRVGVAVIDAMLAPHVSAGRVEVMLRHRPVAADAQGDRVRSVTLRSLDTGDDVTVTADYVLDATELGDVLPLADVEYVTGAESRDDTGEPHAVAEPAQPQTVQAFTWCLPLGFDPHARGDEHVVDRPADYERWREYRPKMSPEYVAGGRLIDWTIPHYITREPRRCVLFEADKAPGGNDVGLFNYRQIVGAGNYAPADAPQEVTLVNWPQNDYLEGGLIDVPAEVAARSLAESKQLSLSLVHWLQTEAERPDGGVGYPGLCLRPDLTGTADGLAKAPYVREARRIAAEFTVTENHVGVDARPGATAAEPFADSVGVGCYRIDLHPCAGLPAHRTNYVDVSSYPFQIPLGALIPRRVDNLLAAGKCLGVTHVTNGCYRLHPVEWNAGESAGLLAAHCLATGASPRAVRGDAGRLAGFQSLLRAQGVELAWPDVHAV